MIEFKPIRIILTLKSPVVLTALAPALDGVLFEAMSQRYPAESHENIVERMKSILAYNSDLGVFHASSMYFGVNSESGLITGNYYRTDYLHEDKRSSFMFGPNGTNGKYKNIIVAGGPTKKRLTSRSSYRAQFVIFDALGDKSAILSLLENTFVGVGYDTQNCGMGQFDVNNIEVIPLPEDISLLKDGHARRQLPAGAALGVEVQTRVLPPYYLKSNIITAVAPERVQLLNVDNF